MCLYPKSSSTNNVSRYEARLLWAIMNGVNFYVAHLIILHMHRVVKKKSRKFPYWALITLILCTKGISFNDDFKWDKLTTLEIGKETLKKMMLRVTSEEWVNTHNEIVHIGHGDDKATKDILKERLGEGVGHVMQSKGKALVGLPNQVHALGRENPHFRGSLRVDKQRRMSRPIPSSTRLFNLFKTVSHPSANASCI